MPVQQAEQGLMTRRQFLSQAFEVTKSGAKVAVSLTVLPALLDACSFLSSSEPASLNLPSEISASLKDGNRFWDDKDLLISQIIGEHGLGYRVTVLEKPPFYTGPIPFEYESIQETDLAGIGVNRVIVDIFDTFTNEYVYGDYFDLKGVRTVNGGTTLAEALIVRTPADSSMGTIPTQNLLEIQYDNSGKICFAAKSELDETGFKTKELVTTGVKRDEYYFMVPIFGF